VPFLNSSRVLPTAVATAPKIGLAWLVRLRWLVIFGQLGITALALGRAARFVAAFATITRDPINQGAPSATDGTPLGPTRQESMMTTQQQRFDLVNT
jgi:hypothetical protein